MAQAPRRAAVRGPTFIRLLAHLSDVDVTRSKQSLSDRLSQWLDWTHAIALSTALDGKSAAPAADVPTFGSAEENECARVRSALATAIAGDRAFASVRQHESEQPLDEDLGANAAVDYSVFRHRYVAMQRAMQTATGNLRGRLRDMLAQKSVGMAQLAEVDAAMELALSPREQTLLATVPTLLGKHFERLRQAGETTVAIPGSSEGTSAATAGAWLNVFCKDMQSVLLAELDVRFQPVEGLLAALRTS